MTRALILEQIKGLPSPRGPTRGQKHPLSKDPLKYRLRVFGSKFIWSYICYIGDFFFFFNF